MNFLVFSAFDRSGLFYKFVVEWKFQLSVYFPNPSLGGKKDSIVREVVCYLGYKIAMTILLLVFACCTRCQVLGAVRKTPDTVWASRKQAQKSQQSWDIKFHDHNKVPGTKFNRTAIFFNGFFFSFWDLFLFLPQSFFLRNSFVAMNHRDKRQFLRRSEPMRRGRLRWPF